MMNQEFAQPYPDVEVPSSVSAARNEKRYPCTRNLKAFGLLLALGIGCATLVGVLTLVLRKPDSAPSESKGLRVTSAPSPNESLGSPAPSTESSLPSLEYVEFRGTKPLGLCQGDCDSNSDCEDGLECFQRSANVAVPGCAKGDEDESRTDYCIAIAKQLPTISFSEKLPLGLCQGDCDSDEDCEGTLSCQQRHAGQEVNGCNGGGEDASETDYCVRMCRPDRAEIRFAGLDSVISYEEGVLELTWLEPDWDSLDRDACPVVEYEVFLVEGAFSYEEGFDELSDFHNSDMITSFTTTELGYTISNLSSTTAYTVLVIAKIGDGWISDNRNGQEVLISKTNPILKPGVKIVNLSDRNIVSQKQGDSLMSFSGGASGTLEAGDFVFGQDEEGLDFLLILEEELIVGSDSVWNASNATLLDIYDVLSLNIVVDLTPTLTSTFPSGRRQLFELPIELPTLTRSAAVGPFQLSYEFKGKVTFEAKVEIDSILTNPVFEISSRTIIETAHTQKSEFSVPLGAGWSDKITKELYYGRRRTKTFFVGWVPIIIGGQPRFDAFLEGSLSAGFKLTTSIETKTTDIFSVSYSKGLGWQYEKSEDSTSIASTDGVEVELVGKAGFGVRFDLSVDFHYLFYIEPGVDVGLSTEVTTKANPPGVAFPPVAIHLSKYELGTLIRLRIAGGIPILKHELALATKEMPSKKLVDLPKPKLVALDQRICQQNEAYSITVQLETGTSGIGGIVIDDPYNFAAGDWSSASGWVLNHSQPGSPQAIISFPRTAMASVDSVEYPSNFDLYSQADINSPPTPFFFALLMHTQDLRSLLAAGNPLPTMFQCCDDSDCKDTSFSCEGFQCVQGDGTAVPTPAATRMPVPETEAPVPETEAPSPAIPAVKSNRGFLDPHFRPWNGPAYGYQGACDLVYLQCSLVTIHIRTTLAQSSTNSYISQVAILLGGDILEIRNDRSYFVNGTSPLNPPQDIGGYPFSAFGWRFAIDLGQGQSIRVESSGRMLTITVTGNALNFRDSRGIPGSYDVDKAILRNGSLVDASPEEIAAEWLVDADKGDELLFLQPPPHEGCLLASPLSPSPEDTTAAEEACSRLENDQAMFNICKFEVLARGDPEAALDEAFDPLPDEPFCANENRCLEGELDSNGVCQYTAIPCSNSAFACDPIDGVCKSQDDLIPSIAVIDESNIANSYFDRTWAEFRSKYPSRPFTILQPPPIAGASLYLPPDFVDDPLTRYFAVNRDVQDNLPPSDWYELSGLAQFSNVKYVGLFVDNSGSLEEWQVQGSIDLFLNRTAEKGLEVRIVTDPNENWILPFNTTLASR